MTPSGESRIGWSSYLAQPDGHTPSLLLPRGMAGQQKATRKPNGEPGPPSGSSIPHPDQGPQAFFTVLRRSAWHLPPVLPSHRPARCPQLGGVGVNSSRVL